MMVRHRPSPVEYCTLVFHDNVKQHDLLTAGAMPPTLPGPGIFPATAAACAAAAA